MNDFRTFFAKLRNNDLSWLNVVLNRGLNVNDLKMRNYKSERREVKVKSDVKVKGEMNWIYKPVSPEQRGLKRNGWRHDDGWSYNEVKQDWTMFEKVSLVEFLWFWYGSNAREETSSIPVKIFNLKKFL